MSDQFTHVPVMTDPLGRYWDQPPRENVRVYETHAEMSEQDLGALMEYSHSIPTGKYVGKMWKAKGADGKWYLRWYDTHEDPDKLSIHTREIRLCR